MGVGLYNLSQAEITKMAMESKSVIAGKKQQNSDPRMSMNGTIFASKTAPQTPATKTTGDLPTGLVNNQNPTDPANGNEPSTTPSNEGGTPSADEGKAMASSMKSQAKDLQNQTKDVEKDATTAKKISADAKETTKDVQKNQKNLEKNIKTTTLEFTKNQQEINKTSELMTATLTSIQTDQAELATLTAGGDTTVFSLSLAGDEQAGGTQSTGNPDQKRINEIAKRLNGNIELLDTQGKQIYSLQKTSAKSLKNINKLNTQYTKSIKNTQKAVKNEQAQNSKVIQVADKVSQISSAVTTGGQTLELVGQGMIAAGGAMTWAAGAGAALIAAGEVMVQVGTVAQTVGNYGTMASELTKGVAFAAEGNLAGALSSITTAAAAGQSAVKSTKAMGATMSEISASADAAKQSLAAGAEARDAVKKMSTDQLGGMTKKEARKSVQANILNEGNLGTGSVKDIRAGISANSEIVNNADGTLSTTSKLDKAIGNTQNQFAEANNAAKTKMGINNSNIDKLSKKGKRQLNKAVHGNMAQTTGATMQNVVKNNPSYAANAGKFNFKDLAGKMQTMASLFGNSGTENTSYASSSGGSRSADPAVMARLRQIQSSRTHIHAA